MFQYFFYKYRLCVFQDNFVRYYLVRDLETTREEINFWSTVDNEVES